MGNKQVVWKIELIGFTGLNKMELTFMRIAATRNDKKATDYF
jgi:hypothetical protein